MGKLKTDRGYFRAFSFSAFSADSAASLFIIHLKGKDQEI